MDVRANENAKHIRKNPNILLKMYSSNMDTPYYVLNLTLRNDRKIYFVKHTAKKS